ncbi:ABC transporter permease [Actinoplanes aureus]|uniref:ABC transporter permease n=1 Tax=Actinoplanes aureus TaxID=2792083 RepID=A0A931CHE2_9ACTN|nr:ABC transporter permease [Actinoplanes aureus]MBG0567308.1 ABC transporter permease [Actinoplanes aureus]
MTGTGTLLAFNLRRDRVALPLWIGGAGLLFLVQSTQSQNLYGTPEELAALRATLGGNTAVIAMSGPVELLDSIGGEIVFEIFAFAAIVVALMNMFLVGRHTRGDEETGRAELIRSARVGRRSPVYAALALAALADLAVGAGVFAVAAGTGLPVGGSLLVAAALAGVGLVFAALTAVAAQVFEHGRGVYGAVGLGIGAAYMLRAAGDAGNPALSWASPIGWGQRTFPYGQERWWPVLLLLGTALALTGIALLALDRRDFGAGLVRSRPGRPRASWALGSPAGLAWRLHRGAVIGWVIGVGMLGAAYGSLGDSIEQYIAENPEVAEFLPGGAADVVDSYLALTVTMGALLAAAFGVAAALRARAEETAGRAEPLLATAVSRTAWLGSHLGVALLGSALVLIAAGFGEGLAYGLTVGEPGQAIRMTGVALAYLPAVWAVVAVAALGLGWWARAAAVAGWVALGYCVVVELFADSFNLPEWAQQASPFVHAPEAPLESVTAAPLIALGVVAAALVAAGLAGFRRRDVGY